MQVKLNNSTVILLLPKGYERVNNGAALYEEMYHRHKAADVEMFQNLAGESYGNIVISHIDQIDAMTFDKNALISEIHGVLADNQGLIEVETGTNPRGFEYVYSIVKTYHQEQLNTNYCIRMNIRNNDELIEVNASFFETRMTGVRSSVGLMLAVKAGFETEEGSSLQIKGWAADPYDPTYTKGCLMLMSERPGLDGMFPGDPLSQARELLLALTADSYYKTKDEIDAENKERVHERRLRRRNTQHENAVGENNNGQEIVRQLFSDDVVRNGAYKVDVVEETPSETKPTRFQLDPASLVKATASAVEGVKSTVTNTAAEFNKVKTPYEIPEDFRNRLNKPIPKKLPGWGKRDYIGYGKGTPLASCICLGFPVTDSESLPLGNTNQLIEMCRGMDDHQGIISVKGGITPKGSRYAYVIRKMQAVDDEGEVQTPIHYELGFNIRINGKIHFIDGSFRDKNGIPGSRADTLNIMALGNSELKLITEQWQRDPYYPDRKSGLLMDWSEDERFDSLFPYSSLSEMRRFVKYIIENN
ncbi:MAG: hypothetical protein K6F23_10210 [Solobacterium sp.]|nr:hypothetical protein [Solobacterium sp.]